MADQIRRVGLLKAVGATPGLIASVLLAEYVILALVAAAAGLGLGLLSCAVAHQSGRRPHRRPARLWLTPSTIELVTVVAARPSPLLATLVPSAPRLADHHGPSRSPMQPAPPRRTAWLIAASARLPVAAAPRPARGRATPAPRPPVRPHRRGHRQRDRRGAGSPRSAERRSGRRVFRVGRSSRRPTEPGAAADHGDARRAGRCQRDLHRHGRPPSTPGVRRRWPAHWEPPPARSAPGCRRHKCYPRPWAGSSGIPGGIGLFDAVSPSRLASLPIWWVLAAGAAGAPLVIAA